MEYLCSPPKRARIEENLNLVDTRFDDCWIQVFKGLSFKERVLLERVSQKWKNLMPYSDIHSLHLCDLDCWSEASKRMKGKYMIAGASKTVKLVKDDHLRQVFNSVLNRIGPYLQELHFLIHRMPIFRLNKVFMDFVVEKAPNLVKLDLTGCLLTLTCFHDLQNLGKLEDLDLCGVTVIEEDLSATVEDLENVKAVVGSTIQNLTSLKNLGLLFGMPVPPLVRNHSLINLTVDGEKMNGESVRDIIQYCPNLEVLLIERDAPSFHWAELGQLHKLQRLSFGTSNFSSGDMAAIGEGCPNLEKLLLSVPHQVNCWDKLWCLRNLKELCLFPDDQDIPVTDSVLASLAKYGLLKTLSLPHTTLTDEGLKHLAKHCPNLVLVNFDSVKRISDEGVKAILEKCKNWEKLFLANNRIGDPTLTAIGAMGSSLRKVNLQGTRVTKNGIRCLFKERKKRVKNGEKLVKLKIRANVECSISRGNLESVCVSVKNKP